MAYDYNSQDNRFDFPNPYRIENYFYFCASAILLTGGVIMLVMVRHALGGGGVALLPLLLGVAMLVHGLLLGAKAMGRLRFFFGRGQPASLAPTLNPEQSGTSTAAAGLADLLRHSSLVFKEPTGPLNGLLYSLFRNLIFAPQLIQVIAQRQFQNALAFLAILLSLLVSLVGASQTSANWLGLFYFGLALVILLKPVERGAQGEVQIGIQGIVGFILAAILGPVLVPMLTRGELPPAWLPGAGQAALVMVAGLVGIGLFFCAVMRQSHSDSPQANMAVVQDTLTMNSHPNQVMDEFERRMQDAWVASLPNRVYTRRVPEVVLNQESGTFEGEALQETQPVPRGEPADLTWKSCFAEPRYRFLSWLNSWGLLTLLVAVVLLSRFAAHFVEGGNIDTAYVTAATLGVAFWMVGNFCFRAGSVLWGRFDFVSRLIWLEMRGNYQAARMDFGNQFTDSVKTEKKVINIESMTLRVWVAEIETVAFGKDTARSLVGMRGLKTEAEGLHRVLHAFGSQQSMVVAPTSTVDLQRAQALSAMNQSGVNKGTASGVAAQIAAALGGDAHKNAQAEAAGATAPSVLFHCPACQPAHAQGAKFCPECGSRLAP